MTPKTNRFAITAIAGLILALAAWLASIALSDNIVYFVTPSQMTDLHKQSAKLRVGGLVAEGSVRIQGTTTIFTITDGTDDLRVEYDGALPDLFREGQGIVAEGAMRPTGLLATTVLAKHDETYMPREVKESLQEQGVWQGNS